MCGIGSLCRPRLLLLTFLAVLGAGVSAVASLGALAQQPTTNFGRLLPARLPASQGKSYYVDGSGGRDTNRGSFRAPWRTLQHALAEVSSGAIVHIRGGVYPGEVEIRGRNFPSSKPVTVTAYRRERPIFVGDRTPTMAGYPALHLFADSGLRIRGLEVSNRNGDGIQIRDSSDIELNRVFVHDNAAQGLLVGGVTFGSLPGYSNNVQIWNSVFTANGTNRGYSAKGDHSIYYGDGSNDGRQHGAVHGVIANNLIYGQTTGRGIQLGQSAWGTVVVNNTVYETSSSSPFAGQSIDIWNNGDEDFPTRGLILLNNLFVQSSGEGVYGSCSSSMPSNLVDYNLTYANAKGPFAQYDGGCLLYTLGSHNLQNQDPLLLDPLRRDFRPGPGSPAVARGAPQYTPPYDAAGRLRRTADLGAFAAARR